MYFVVYVLQTKQNLVVPASWISSADKLIEHFINYSINSNKSFLFYWTGNPQAFHGNGLPRFEYKPNVHAVSTNEFPKEGWYRCQMKRFHREF